MKFKLAIELEEEDPVIDVEVPSNWVQMSPEVRQDYIVQALDEAVQELTHWGWEPADAQSECAFGDNNMFVFPVTLVGYGKNADEAWDDACEGFEENHGPTPSVWTLEAVDAGAS